MYGNTERIKLGSIGVDSGQMMLCDPCYIESSWKKGEFNGEKIEEMKKSKEYEFGYSGACAATLQEEGPKAHIGDILGRYSPDSEDGTGAVCSSGFGDGCYEVWVEVEDHGPWGRRVSKMEIIFIGDEEEDEDY
jgi:hypothetical protein